MYRIFIILLIGLIPIILKGQFQSEDSKRLTIAASTILSDNNSNLRTKIQSSKHLILTINSSTILPDTLKSFLVKKDPPILYSLKINHAEKPFFNKMVRGNNYTMGYNVFIMTFLLIIPEAISKWDKENDLNFPAIGRQYRNSYTKPPVIDHDMFITNYLGHPYQGGFYYNSVRSQGATVLQSSLFCWGQTLLWEYGWEAGLEQPSIQDLIVTPLAGILVGELSHIATIKMSRNGFNSLEKVITCIINPSWVINNKFIFNKNKLPETKAP